MNYISRWLGWPKMMLNAVATVPVRWNGVVGMIAAVLLHAILAAVFFTCSVERSLNTGNRTVTEVQLSRLEPVSAPASSLAEAVDVLPAGSLQQSAIGSSHSKTPSLDEVEASNPPELVLEKEDLSNDRVSFLPAGELDRRPLPVSEPDIGMLNGSISTGLPIKLRLFINSYGYVSRIDVLVADEGDTQFIERLKQMFFATRYIPGRLNGLDVDAFTDIQLNAAPLPFG